VSLFQLDDVVVTIILLLIYISKPMQATLLPQCIGATCQ
jgi:hypothetical protein